MRGDASRDMKQTIIETLEQGPAQASPDYVPIFKDIVVPSLNVASPTPTSIWPQPFSLSI